MTNETKPAHVFGTWDEPVEDLAYILWNSREWHKMLQQRFTFHPVLKECLKLGKCCDWHRLVLEWPHRAEKDPKQLAYTRDERKGESDVQTVTTVGKYVKRHFPTMKDDVVRDLVYKHSATGCKLLWTTEEIVGAVQNGPYSCMQWDEDEIERRGGHPYGVYCPTLGWGIGVRYGDEGEIVARALVNKGAMQFVRTYGPSGKGQPDGELEAWLETQGYTFVCGWREGLKLKKISGRYGNPFLPYIDGDNQGVESRGDTWAITEDSDGEYVCCNQDGSADEANGEPCPDCGQRTDDEDRNYVGRHHDDWVCNSCCENNYTWIEGGRRHDGYYLHEDNVTYVDGDPYDENNLPDYIIELADGDYCHRDNAVECCETNEWYRDDDRSIVSLGNGDYCHRDYAWQCEDSGEWYSDSEDYVMVGGYKYHPDNAPDEDEDEGELADCERIKAPLGNYDKPEGSIPNESQIPLEIQDGPRPHKWQHILDALAAGVPCEWSFNGEDWFVADPKETCCDDAQYRIIPIRVCTREVMQEALDKGGVLQQLYQGVWVDWNSHQGVPYDGHTGTFRIKPGSIVTTEDQEVGA